MAVNALHFISIRRMVYLYEPATTNQEQHDEQQVIDKVAAEGNEDELFLIESQSGFSEIEQKYRWC